MAMIEIEQNDPHTLELARLKISQVANAHLHSETCFCWGMAAGYFMALSTHRLIDKAAFDQLDAELNQARDTWQAPNQAR